jgi:hypothetical protein
MQALHGYRTMDSAHLRYVNRAFSANPEAAERKVNSLAAIRFSENAARSFAGTRDNDVNMRLKYDPSLSRFAYFLHEKGVSQ